mmetsp:Transcript_41776/g.75044  ORF Transcript_41776/g.75044 Transcript_41776/m.75044 type:complete len:253 (-) Transcript_41776:604-1362(-)
MILWANTLDLGPIFEVCEGANTLKVAGGGLVAKAVIEQAKVPNTENLYVWNIPTLALKQPPPDILVRELEDVNVKAVKSSLLARGYDISQGPLVVVIFKRVGRTLEQVQNNEVRDIPQEFEVLHLNSGVDAHYCTLNHRIYVLGGNHTRHATQSLLRSIDGDTAVSTLWTSLATVPCVVFANVSMSILRWLGTDLNVGHSISATNTHCDNAERLRTEFDKFARKLEREHRIEDMTDEEWEEYCFKVLGWHRS